MSYEIKVVSLQRRSDRRTYMTELFEGKYTFEFHDAIDGTTLDSNVSASLFTESTFHEWNGSVPAMKAISLTNYGIWQESYTQDKNIVIFEDDITIETDEIFDFDTIFNEVDFDIYFLNPAKIPVEYHNDIRARTDTRYQSSAILYPNCFCYMVNPSGARKLYDYFTENGIKKTIDWEICELPISGSNSFNVKCEENVNFSKLTDNIEGTGTISKSDILLNDELYYRKKDPLVFPEDRE
jgi:GR25 family glycosyltransferase involved in LPS biosynthesis